MDTMQEASEDQECATFFDWCLLNHIPCVHIANEGKRTFWEGKRLKRIGLCSGFPDYFIHRMRKGYGGLLIEMKTKKGRLTKKQEEYLKILREDGYLAYVSYGADEAISYVKNYLDIL